MDNYEIEQNFERIYRDFRLRLYKYIFSVMGEREGSLTVTEFFSVETIALMGSPTVSEFADALSITSSHAAYKVRQLIGLRPALIESVDSERLLRAIDAESERAGIVSRVLMQVHVAQEETKFGMTPDEMLGFFADRRFESLKATHICGMMAMASNTDDEARVRADFESVARLRSSILDVAPDLRGFDILSMGMSHDYPLAVAAGANLVRVGSAIFGDRGY